MSLMEKFKYRVFGADPESVAAYQTVLPHNIYVRMKKDGSYLIAKIDAVDDKKLEKSLLITEAKDIDSLVSNVNDLLYTYVNMPLNIRPYYGNVFKPEGYKTKELKGVKAEKELVLARV